MNTKEILTAARALIEKPENWCQGAYALTANRAREVSPLDEYANCFCMIGACSRALQQEVDLVEDEHAAYKALRKAVRKTPCEYNDSHTHAEVLKVFDRAIAAA